MVEQVLLDREIEVEGRLLEDDAHLPQALRGVLANIHAEDADYALRAGDRAGWQGRTASSFRRR